MLSHGLPSAHTDFHPIVETEDPVGFSEEADPTANLRLRHLYNNELVEKI